MVIWGGVLGSDLGVAFGVVMWGGVWIGHLGVTLMVVTRGLGCGGDRGGFTT